MSSSSSMTDVERDAQHNDQAHKQKEHDVESGAGTRRPSIDAEQEKPAQDVLDPTENPKNFSSHRKWMIVVTVSLAAFCVTSCSSIAAYTQSFVGEEFHVAHIVTVLSISLFVLGLALGPLLIGPLSEVYGRNPVYRGSYILFFAFSWPVAFAPDIATYLVFRFLTGFCGSAFLSVAGGSVSDLFENEKIASPMALYTVAPFIGPVFGPLISGFINQHLYWRWTFRIMLVWIFVQLVALWLLVPETYVPVIKQKKIHGAAREDPVKIMHMILDSCYTPFKLIFFERMALLLNLWNAILLAIVYLTFQVFPLIFQAPHLTPSSSLNSKFTNPTPEIYGHAFSIQLSGLTFLGMGAGMLLAALCPGPHWWARVSARTSQGGQPEARLLMGELGGVLVPLSLFGIAFTTYPSVHWIAPILCSVPLGMGVFYVFSSTFTYLVVAYRPIAASAMASNTAMRCALSAILPLWATPMYERMGTVGATVFLAGVMALLAPLPFVFRRRGREIRRGSRFAMRD